MLPTVRRLLAWGVALAVLLPLVIMLVLALGGLLAGAGDRLGGVICSRIALAIGLIWVAAVVTTAVTGGLLTLEAGPGEAEDPPTEQQQKPADSEAAGR